MITDVKKYQDSDGVMVYWTDVDSDSLTYEVWCSLNGGVYALIGRTVGSARKYKDTGATLANVQYKIKKILSLENTSNFLNKLYFTGYDITPMFEPNGAALHVEFQREDMIFASKTGYLMWSDDAGLTFNSVSFTDSNIIVYSHIFSNGNILFATRKNELWLGKNSLGTITQKYLKDTDDNNFVYHTPVNASYPGLYFRCLNINEPTIQEGLEMLVFSNYSMYTHAEENGATPSFIFYSPDLGETVKIAYKFGVQLLRDDGTATGSNISGNLLGDPGSSIVCVHTHYVTYDKYTNQWICGLGEGGYFVIGDYNIETDTWDWNLLTGGAARFRSCGIFIDSIYYYLLSDEQTPSPMGVWRCLKSDLNDYTKYTKIFDCATPLAPGLIYGNIVIGGHYNVNMGASVSIDGLTSWDDYFDIPILLPLAASKTLPKIGYPNSNGEIVVTPYNWNTDVPYGKQSYLIKFK